MEYGCLLYTSSKHGYCRFSETISNAMNGSNPVVALTGPTHAEEVARGIPTAIVAASESRAAAELTQAAFMNDTNFRVYTSVSYTHLDVYKRQV